MEELKRPSFDDVFMTQVYLIASRSSDANTHIGAVIVNPHNVQVSAGYNGFPRGMDDKNSERQERPEKYFWMEHAERNSIYNAARLGVSLIGCKMYTNGIPCMDCGRAVVQSGIVEVIVDKRWDVDNNEKWAENAKRTIQLFYEANVKIRYWEGNFVELHKFKNGERKSLI
jgi:dCMP deaminase